MTQLGRYEAQAHMCCCLSKNHRCHFGSRPGPWTISAQQLCAFEASQSGVSRAGMAAPASSLARSVVADLANRAASAPLEPLDPEVEQLMQRQGIEPGTLIDAVGGAVDPALMKPDPAMCALVEGLVAGLPANYADDAKRTLDDAVATQDFSELERSMAEMTGLEAQLAAFGNEPQVPEEVPTAVTDLMGNIHTVLEDGASSYTSESEEGPEEPAGSVVQLPPSPKPEPVDPPATPRVPADASVVSVTPESHQIGDTLTSVTSAIAQEQLEQDFSAASVDQSVGTSLDSVDRKPELNVPDEVAPQNVLTVDVFGWLLLPYPAVGTAHRCTLQAGGSIRVVKAPDEFKTTMVWASNVTDAECWAKTFRLLHEDGTALSIPYHMLSLHSIEGHTRLGCMLREHALAGLIEPREFFYCIERKRGMIWQLTDPTAAAMRKLRMVRNRSSPTSHGLATCGVCGSTASPAFADCLGLLLCHAECKAAVELTRACGHIDEAKHAERACWKAFEETKDLVQAYREGLSNIGLTELPKAACVDLTLFKPATHAELKALDENVSVSVAVMVAEEISGDASWGDLAHVVLVGAPRVGYFVTLEVGPPKFRVSIQTTESGKHRSVDTLRQILLSHTCRSGASLRATGRYYRRGVASSESDAPSGSATQLDALAKTLADTEQQVKQLTSIVQTQNMLMAQREARDQSRLRGLNQLLTRQFEMLHGGVVAAVEDDWNPSLAVHNIIFRADKELMLVTERGLHNRTSCTYTPADMATIIQETRRGVEALSLTWAQPEDLITPTHTHAGPAPAAVALHTTVVPDKFSPQEQAELWAKLNSSSVRSTPVPQPTPHTITVKTTQPPAPAGMPATAEPRQPSGSASVVVPPAAAPVPSHAPSPPQQAPPPRTVRVPGQASVPKPKSMASHEPSNAIKGSSIHLQSVAMRHLTLANKTALQAASFPNTGTVQQLVQALKEARSKDAVEAAVTALLKRQL